MCLPSWVTSTTPPVSGISVPKPPTMVTLPPATAYPSSAEVKCTERISGHGSPSCVQCAPPSVVASSESVPTAHPSFALTKSTFGEIEPAGELRCPVRACCRWWRGSHPARPPSLATTTRTRSRSVRWCPGQATAACRIRPRRNRCERGTACLPATASRPRRRMQRRKKPVPSLGSRSPQAWRRSGRWQPRRSTPSRIPRGRRRQRQQGGVAIACP